MSVMSTIRNKKLMTILLILAIYGTSIVLLKGKLPNQTATLADVQSNNIESLVVNQTAASIIVSLSSSTWNISGEDVSAYNSEEKLIISGAYTNETLPLFTAQQTGLQINFSETPYLHVIISSSLDVTVDFNIGFPDENLEIVWINVSSSECSEGMGAQTHYLTIDVAKRLSELGLENQLFVGLQIKQYLIEQSIEKRYETTIKSMCLLSGLPYYIASTEGKSQVLTDGSIVQIIKRDKIASHEECPYLQRAYILYSMDAPQDSLYTIFLLSKHNENLTAVRCGFIFINTNHFNEIGTHIDWRRPLQFDLHSEPVATLYNVMEDGDYALIFTPLEGDELQSIKLYKIEFTFSKLPYSSFVITDLNEGFLLVMSLFIVITAGILPTVLLCVLFYMHKTNRLKDSKTIVIKIVIIALALRLILAPISAYADDIQIFSEIGALYFGSGVLGAQWVSLPGFVYLETATYFPYALSRAFGFQDSQFLALAIYSGEALFTKLPSILSDLGSFYFLLKIADKYASKEKMLVAGLYLFSPLTIYTSGILGQFDSIFTFAVIASTYYLVAEYNIFKATMFSSFASLLNPVGIATFIPLIVKISLKDSRRALIKSMLLAAVIIGVSILPFFFETKSPLLLASYERLRSGVPGDAFYGKPISFFAYGAHITSSVGYGLTYRFLPEMLGLELWPILYPYGAAIVFLIILGLFVYKTRRAHVIGLNDMIYVGTFMLAVTSLFQLTFPTIFDQFVVWIVGLSLVSYVLCKNRKLLYIFAFISIATGVIYVFSWRDYLLLVSGVETVSLGKKLIPGAISAIIGTLYSIILFIMLIILLRMWIKNAKLSKD